MQRHWTYSTSKTSIDRPQARRRQLEQMPIRVAEVDAHAAAGPLGAAFDRNPMLAEPLFPVRQSLSLDGKRDVQRTVAIVRRDGTARHAHSFERRSAPKQQQHVLAADIIGAKARVA